MADLGYYTGSGEKITKAESEKRFPKKTSSSSSSSPKLTFENAPAGYVLNTDGTIRKEGTFSSDQEVTQTVQAVQAPPQSVTNQPTSRTIRTPATTENVDRALSNPDEFAQEAITRDRNDRAKEDIDRLIREDIAAGVKPTPQTVGRTIKESKTEKATLTSQRAKDFLFDKGEQAFNYFETKGEDSLFLTRAKENRALIQTFPEKIFIAGDKTTQKLSKKRKTVEGNTFESFGLGAAQFGTGVAVGATNVLNLAVNPETTIFPVAKMLIKEPVKTTKDVLVSMGGAGDKIRTASDFQTGTFGGEVVASFGVEALGAKFIFQPLKRKIVSTATKLSPDYVPVIEKPLTKTVDVKGFLRTNTRKRAAGEALPDQYVFGTDDYIVTESTTKPFTREVKTGGTEKVIEGVPSSKEPVDIKLVGNYKSNAADLKTQLDFAGEKTDLVSAQSNLIQGQNQVFGRDASDFVTTKPNPNPMEQSFFFSPKGELRLSRFIDSDDSLREPNFIDLVTENFNNRNEIVLKPQTKVKEFPSHLQPGADFIAREGAARPGESASAAVSRTRTGLAKDFPEFEKDLLKFQLETKGEPTTPGFVSSESEIVYSSGQAARGERVGVTVIEGQRVKIFEETLLNPSTNKKVLTATAVDNFMAQESLSSNNLNNFIAGSTRKTSSKPPVAYKEPIIPSGSLSSIKEQPATTKSLTGLEVANPSLRVSTKTSSPSSSLSRGFIAPSAPSYTATPTRTRDTPRVPYIPLSPTPRNGGGRSRTPPPIISQAPPPIIREPSRPIRTPTTPYRRPVSTPRTILTPRFIPKIPTNKPRSGGSFTTQVLKQGRFVTVGLSTNLKAATLTGTRSVGGSALRSFRVLKGATPVNLKGSTRFRRSKSKSSTLVEKSKFAINTPGEVYEIPGSKRRKRRF